MRRKPNRNLELAHREESPERVPSLIQVLG
jgi:hypothetical protein